MGSSTVTAPTVTELREVGSRAGWSAEQVATHLGITRSRLFALQRSGDAVPDHLVEGAERVLVLAGALERRLRLEAEALEIALASWSSDVRAWGHTLRDNRTEATARGYELHVSWLARDLAETVPSPWQLQAHVLEGWLDRHSWSAETRRKVLVSLKAFYTWGLVEGRCQRSPVAGVAVAPSRKPGPRARPLPGDGAWAEPLRQYSRALYAANRAETTRRLYMNQLLSLAEMFANPWAITHLDLVQYVGRPDLAPQYRKSIRTAIRGFFLWAEDSDVMPHDAPNPAAKLPSVRVPRSLPRPAPDEAVLQALESADNRVHLMLSVAIYTGVRRFELAKIHSDDIGDDVLLIHGKGDKDRLVPIHPDLAVMLRAELRRRREGTELLEGWGPVVPPVRGWLFPSPHGGHLSVNHVGKLVRDELCDRWTTHTLRHRFATQAYRVHRDLRAVQELLGHSKPETTAIYAHVPGESLRSAVAGVGPVTMPEPRGHR